MSLVSIAVEPGADSGEIIAHSSHAAPPTISLVGAHGTATPGYDACWSPGNDRHNPGVVIGIVSSTPTDRALRLSRAYLLPRVQTTARR